MLNASIVTTTNPNSVTPTYYTSQTVSTRDNVAYVNPMQNEIDELKYQVETLLKIINEEQILIANNPALKDIYDQYLIIRKLA